MHAVVRQRQQEGKHQHAAHIHRGEEACVTGPQVPDKPKGIVHSKVKFHTFSTHQYVDGGFVVKCEKNSRRKVLKTGALMTVVLVTAY